MNAKQHIVVLALGLCMLGGNSARAGDVNDILNNSLGSIDSTYHGQHRFFNDDVIGNVMERPIQWFQHDVLEPFIKGVITGNPWWLILAVIVVGFLLRVGASFCDSLGESAGTLGGQSPAGRKP
jgi:hypothetical protein